MSRTISTEELVSLKESAKGITILNVLSAEEYEKEHIPGSTSAPIDSPNFMKHVEARTGGDTNMMVILYCAGNPCDASSRAAHTLAEAGYSDVWEYSGGMGAWKGSQQLEGSQARPSQEAMASIAAAVRAGEAAPSFGQLDLDDEEERELAGSEPGAERENWNAIPRAKPPAPRLQPDRAHAADDADGRYRQRDAS